MRVYELAKKLNISNKELIKKLNEEGFSIKSHMSAIEEEIAQIISEKIKPIREEKKYPSDLQERVISEKEKRKKIVISEGITVGELAEKMNRESADLIKKFIELGKMITKTTPLDIDSAGIIVCEFGFEPKVISLYGEDLIPTEEDSPESFEPRPPVITILGHVDHGKTTLLDAIRQTNIVEKEIGNITQHIGAYEVTTNKGKLTFLDTPGHEAFTAMRIRGVKVTDIAVLVVAADESVQPQTIEAINHTKIANIPILVAINKIDKPGININRVKQDLMHLGYVPEEWGGKTIFVEISAKEKIGIDTLLEMLLLEAEMLELKTNFKKLAKGVIIEAYLDKGKGAVGTVLIQEGALHLGDSFLAGNCWGKVRIMYNDKGQAIREAIPSMPVEVVGFSKIPYAGDIFQVVQDERLCRHIALRRKEIQRTKTLQHRVHISLENLYKEKVKELKIIIKADVRGSIEALKDSLQKIPQEEIRINVIHIGVGAINESDVLLAEASDAIIIGFHVRCLPKAKILAERMGINIHFYQVIYEAVNEIKKALEGLLDPDYKEIFVGEAVVKEIFRISKVGIVGGCLVTKGKVDRNYLVRVIRNNIVIHEGKISSLKRFKDEVTEVLINQECGIKLANFDDIKQDDIIEIYELRAIKKAL